MKFFTGLFLIVLISFSTTITAQKILWERNLGSSGNDLAYDIQATREGGSIVAGRAAGSGGDVTEKYGSGDFWVIKLDAAGEIEWEENYGGSKTDRGRCIIETFGGGYMVAGSSTSDDYDVPGNNGYWDGLLIKMNTSGEATAGINYGGSGDDRIYSIQQTNDMGYILAGSSRPADTDDPGTQGEIDYWILKLNIGGFIEWENIFGGSEIDIPASVEQTDDGGYIVAGTTYSDDGDVPGSFGNSDCWVMKLDSDGDIIWSDVYGGRADDKAHSVQQTDDGGYMVAGSTKSQDYDVTGNNGRTDAWILKLDPEGDIEWEKNYGGSEIDYAKSIVHTTDGNYIVAGVSYSEDHDVSMNYGSDDLWIFAIDSAGNMLWEKNYGGSEEDQAMAIRQLNNGTYVVAGFSESNDLDVSDNQGGYDYWVLNICNQTRVEIEETFCGSYTVPSGDETYTSPGTYTDTIPNYMGCDSIITIHLTETNEGNVDTSVYVEGNILQAAQFEAFYQWGRCTENGFEPIAGATSQTYTATGSGEYAVWVMMGGCSDTSQCHTVNLSTGITETPLPLVNIYPNPADNELTVYLGEEYQTSYIVISNLYGQEVLHKVVHARRPEITLPLDIPAGYYIVTVRQDGVKRSFKFQKLSESTW